MSGKDPHVVKDGLIRREQEWARGTTSSRAIDDRVARGLERASQRNAERKTAPAGPSASELSERRQERRKELAARAKGKFWTRPAPAKAKPRGPRCRGCGTCLACRRAARVRLLMSYARKGDARLAELAWGYFALVNALKSGGTYKDHLDKPYPFGEMSRRSRGAAFLTAMDDILDRSATLGLGAWR